MISKNKTKIANRKKSKTTIKRISKIILPSIFVVVLLAIILVSFLNLKGTTGSVFNISELDKKIDLVQPGDIINYEINGYNDWQVLRKDKYNGTVDVISRTNVKNITFIAWFKIRK